MKKIIAIALSVVFVLGTFSGCRAEITEDGGCAFSAWTIKEQINDKKAKFISVCSECGKEREYKASFSKGLEYKENEDGTLSVAGIGECEDTFLYIGTSYKGKAVTSIEPHAFNGNENIKYVYIAQGIKSVGDHAFISIPSLLSVTIGDGVEYLGMYAFYECVALYDIIIPASLKAIEEYTFSGCFNLREAKLHDGITKVGKGAYSRCESIREFKLPKGTKTLEEHTFDACINLFNVDLTGDEGSIPESFFASCESLEKFEIPEGITFIETKAFIGCKALSELYIPASVSGIEVRDGESPFYMCDDKKLTVKCESPSRGADWAEDYDVCNYIEYDDGEKPMEKVRLTFLFGQTK